MRLTFPRAVMAGALLTAAGATCLFGSVSATASPRPEQGPGALVVTRLHYAGTPGMITPGVTTLPTGAKAIADGSFAHVWDNVTVDGNFGVTAPEYLDAYSTNGRPLGSYAVPAGARGRGDRSHDVMTGSFSSKSEGALNLSTDGSSLSFMGYVAPANSLDVSNDNTPGVVDPTNPDSGTNYRAIGTVDSRGRFTVTETNAYSGDNGRAAILDDATGRYYAAGNSNNGSGTGVPGVIYGTGAQLVTPAKGPERVQKPGQPTPAGGFSVTQIGVAKADKLGKDTNFAGVTVHDGVVYYSKGSGSNGVDTIYFIDTTGKACPTGVGTPIRGAAAPTTPDTVNPTTGEPGYNMCILKGFPTGLAKSVTTPEVGGPQNATAFGAMWFANDSTLYVADAGNGTDTNDGSTYTAAAQQTLAGIQKWSLIAGTWTYDYTLQSGLGLGQPYTVKGLPTGVNSLTGDPWAPAVDGVRNIAGRVNRDGSVSLWGVTSAIGGVSDPGADPNRIVTVTDRLSAQTVPSAARFTTVKAAAAGDVYRGVALAPSR
ncbi:hypothetical protein [Frondihabitans australicus]|uniref:Uncharacterized protein n=1 Tax=Frondihabitans australicus TaxID=386892 RepID=A0A495IJS8_9MICO|nr:hypothetical protein [Frondihabitans australicus]RKR75668.1 hypothetical protein C8E83_2816 [Frondihabitans australicus]